jgi:hypothetical protein
VSKLEEYEQWLKYGWRDYMQFDTRGWKGIKFEDYAVNIDDLTFSDPIVEATKE